MTELIKDQIAKRRSEIRELQDKIASLNKEVFSIEREAITKCNHEWKTLKNYEHEGGNCIKCGLNQLYVESELRRMK